MDAPGRIYDSVNSVNPRLLACKSMIEGKPMLPSLTSLALGEREFPAVVSPLVSPTPKFSHSHSTGYSSAALNLFSQSGARRNYSASSASSASLLQNISLKLWPALDLLTFIRLVALSIMLLRDLDMR